MGVGIVMDPRTDTAVLRTILERVEKKLDEHTADHEARLRALEQNQARNTGAAAAIGAVVTLLGSWILSLLKIGQQ